MSHKNGRRVRFDILGRMIAEKRSREDMSLRAAAIDTGISASTLSRIENGKSCEADQIATLADWLGVSATRFISTSGKENLPRVVRTMLLADPMIGRDEADALSGTFASLYRQMTVGKR